MAGVAAVVGNSHKALAPEIVLGLAHRSNPSGSAVSAAPSNLVTLQSLLQSGAPPSAPIWADDRFAHSFIEEAQLVPGEQTRPNLKIQEGCGNRCTFCVIPQTRGESKSLPLAVVMRQVEGFVAAGGNELVLSGINLGRWGWDLPESDRRQTLASLVRQILRETSLPRLRLSSIEPMDWNADLIGLLAEFGGTRIARHAHLPLQSGSDAVLRRMHRRYRPWHYAQKVEALLQAAGPELTLGADVMVGFPGETDAEFAETVALIRALPFGYLHLFPFSPRPQTHGWTLHVDSPVVPQAVDERMSALRALAAEKSQTHRSRFIGRELDAITLHTPPALAQQHRSAALTENFLPVEIDGALPANRLLCIRISALNSDGALEASQASLTAPSPPSQSNSPSSMTARSCANYGCP
jgi:threonylcarbamoyladenosine tRNA methylthiotransferase MtaB